MDLFKMYEWISIVLFVCLIAIFLFAPETFRIG
jgi:hypothetical protein